MWKFRGNEFMQTKRAKDVMKSVDDRIEIREVHRIFLLAHEFNQNLVIRINSIFILSNERGSQATK